MKPTYPRAVAIEARGWATLAQQTGREMPVAAAQRWGGEAAAAIAPVLGAVAATTGMVACFIAAFHA